MGKIVLPRSPSRILLVALALLALIACNGHRVAAQVVPSGGTSATVTSDPMDGSPYEVLPNGDSTLTYNLTYQVGPDSEGVTPSVTSITAVFTVDHGGVIAESGASSWTDKITDGFSTPMVLSCQANGPTDGSYSVTCHATINLSDGTQISSNTATDGFLVEDIAVNVNGPPYVIYDNSLPYDNKPVVSKYTASVSGEPAGVALSYEWSTSANIDDLSSGAASDPTTIETDGNDPESEDGSPGFIDCALYQGVYPFIADAATGQKQVVVHDEFTDSESQTTTRQNGATQTWGSEFTVQPPGGSFSVQQGTSFSVSVTEGISVSASAPTPVVDWLTATFGVSLRSQQSLSKSLSETMTQNLVVGQATDYIWEKTPVTVTTSGTAEQWGTSGLLGTYPWTDPQYSTTDWELVVAGAVPSGGAS